jgi:uncharacterized protein YndB with AHSA1/START domain
MMTDSNHEIAITATPNKVFAAWTTNEGLTAWWTSRASVAKERGGVHVFEFEGGTVRIHFRIDALVPGEQVRWTGVPGDRMPSEWVGTTIDVRIGSLADGRARMRFTHGNWASMEGAYATCNTTWGELVYRLRDWCEGKGSGPLFTTG